MKGVCIHKNSPYYWIRYYDKLEPNPSNKRKWLNTKIEVSESDRVRKGKGLRLIGTTEVRRLADGFRTGLAERNIEARSGVKIKKGFLLSEGYAEFVADRTVPGSKKEIKLKTIRNYNLAVNHMLKACGDKIIYKYTIEKDYVALLKYLDNLTVLKRKENKKTGESELVSQKMSINSKSIYTRSLRALWNYFCDKNYAIMNIIEPVESEEVDPDPIPLDQMGVILYRFKQEAKHLHYYRFVLFLLLTGCRPSSAMVQLKEDIDFKRNVITIRNVKTGKKKKKNFYKFPLYSELKKLLREMVRKGDSGRLFDMFKLNEVNYTYPLSFWERAIKVLKLQKQIDFYYTMKQIRSTTASFMINVLKMNIFTVKKLLDHVDIKITEKHYISFNIDKARVEMDDFEWESILDLEEEI